MDKVSKAIEQTDKLIQNAAPAISKNLVLYECISNIVVTACWIAIILAIYFIVMDILRRIKKESFYEREAKKFVSQNTELKEDVAKLLLVTKELSWKGELFLNAYRSNGVVIDNEVVERFEYLVRNYKNARME